MEIQLEVNENRITTFFLIIIKSRNSISHVFLLQYFILLLQKFPLLQKGPGFKSTVGFLKGVWILSYYYFCSYTRYFRFLPQSKVMCVIDR